MADTFDLPVTYHGEEIFFRAELMPVGYTHKIRVTIDGTDIFFEPDEERNYRGMIDHADRDKGGQLNKELLQNISETLHELFGS